MYYFFDKDGNKVYCEQIKIIAKSLKKENLKDIKKELLEVLNFKGYDGICWFEEMNE